MPDVWKELYKEAAEFKSAPHRKIKPDMIAFWNGVRDFFLSAMVRCAGVKKHNDLQDGLYYRSSISGENSLKNCIKYCIKSRALPLANLWYYQMPAVAVLADEVYSALNMSNKNISESKLYQQWLIFN
jgi:hypothetical protein